MVTHTCKLVVICNQDRYQRFVGSRQHQRQVPSHKLQVTSGIYSSTQSTQSTHSSYKSQVTSYKLQVTNKDKEIPSLNLLFWCCLARNIWEPPRNCVADLFMIFLCSYVAFPEIPEFVHLYCCHRLCIDLQSCPYYLGINISWGGYIICTTLYTTTLSGGKIIIQAQCYYLQSRLCHFFFSGQRLSLEA